MAISPNRRAGIIFFKRDGVQYSAKGNYSYNLGHPRKEAIVGADGVHGYKETPQVAFIEGAVTDDANLDLASLVQSVDGTVTLELANGKVVTLHEAWYAGEGTASTEEGEIPVRYESRRPGEEV